MAEGGGGDDYVEVRGNGNGGYVQDVGDETLGRKWVGDGLV